MPTLMLIRLQPLSDEERRRLPQHCVEVEGATAVVARADVELSVPELFKLAVAMGRAVPDAEFAFHPTSPSSGRVPRPTIPLSPSEDDSAIWEAEVLEDEPVIEESPPSPEEWWTLLAGGNAKKAMETLTQKKFNMDDRNELRTFFKSDDPKEVLFVCEAVVPLEWKSFVMTLRLALQNPSPSVRRGAVLAIGALAGPSMEPSVRLLLPDRDHTVREAAQKALKLLNKR